MAHHQSTLSAALKERSVRATLLGAKDFDDEYYHEFY